MKFPAYQANWTQRVEPPLKLKACASLAIFDQWGYPSLNQNSKQNFFQVVNLVAICLLAALAIQLNVS
jgi:hypothetical protein